MASDGSDLRGELISGLRETSPYLLSHHRPAEHDRCYTLRVSERRIRLCARCLGIYPGIFVGIGLAATLLSGPLHLVIVAVTPAPALIDWLVTTGSGRSGHNPIRTVTGGLLGLGYGAGLIGLFGPWTIWVLAIGIGYGLSAVFLLRQSRAHSAP